MEQATGKMAWVRMIEVKAPATGQRRSAILEGVNRLSGGVADIWLEATAGGKLSRHENARQGRSVKPPAGLLAWTSSPALVLGRGVLLAIFSQPKAQTKSLALLRGGISYAP